MDFETFAVFLFNGAILALVAWIIARAVRRRRAFTRKEGARQALARWRYPVEEWQRFCDAEAKRLAGRGVVQMLLKLAAPALFMFALVWFMYDPRKTYMFDPRIAILPLIGLIALVVVGFVLWTAWDYVRLRGYDAEVAIGPEGIYETYSRHGETKFERKIVFGPDYDLGGAVLVKDGDHRYIALTLRGYRGGTTEKRIPVPRGHEPIAERVTQSLAARAK
jgi:hypothetical protein